MKGGVYRMLTGNKKQGWMNVAYMVGYVLIAVTVISFCVGKIAGVSFSI